MNESRALCQPPNKQLQRTVIRHRVRAANAPFHYAHCGALDRHARPLNCGVRPLLPYCQ